MKNPIAIVTLIGVAAVSGLLIKTVSTPDRSYLAEELKNLNQSSLMNQGGGTIESATAGYDYGVTLTTTISQSPEHNDPLVIPISKDMAPGTEWGNIRVLPDHSVKTATLTKGLHRGCWEHLILRQGEVWTHDGVLVDDRGTVKMERCTQQP